MPEPSRRRKKERCVQRVTFSNTMANFAVRFTDYEMSFDVHDVISGR